MCYADEYVSKGKKNKIGIRRIRTQDVTLAHPRLSSRSIEIDTKRVASTEHIQLSKRHAYCLCIPCHFMLH